MLTAKTIGSIPTKILFLSESLPNGDHGCLIRRISRFGFGTIEKRLRKRSQK